MSASWGAGADNPFMGPFMATAEAVAAARREVDPELARELLQEAAVLLHNGMALEGLSPADEASVIAGLCDALVAEDPGAAVRWRSQSAAEDSAGLEEPAAVSAAYLIAASILQL